jgi:hypothetical protein
VERTVRPKYACHQCEGTENDDKSAVRIAPVESVMIPRNMASAGLLSTVFTQKFKMHLPYYNKMCLSEFLSERKARAEPVLEKFKTWLVKRKDEVPPSLLLDRAVNYKSCPR